MELDQDTAYQVYLLRLWRERSASPECPAVLRYSVEDTHTHQRRGFGSLEELMAFLRTRVEAGGPSGRVHAEPNTQGGQGRAASLTGAEEHGVFPCERS